MDEMINNAEEFYQSLGVAYRIVNIVSGKLYCVCMHIHVHVHVRLCVYEYTYTLYNSMVKCFAFGEGGWVDRIAYIV